MAFRNSIQNIVQSAFVTLSDIAETVIYTSFTDGNYDTYSGQIINIETEYTFKAVVKYLGNKTEANEIESTFTGNTEIMFASKDLAIVPSTSDTVTRSGEIYSINSIKSDPVGATYTLNLVRLG